MKQSLQEVLGGLLVASSLITMSFTESTVLITLLAAISLLSYTQLIAKPHTPKS